MSNTLKGISYCAMAAAAFVVLGPHAAHAATTGGSMPWDTPLQSFGNDIKGPVAYGGALVGIVGSGYQLMFGGEIGEFTRRVMYGVLAAGVTVGGASLLSNLYGSGALVG